MMMNLKAQNMEMTLMERALAFKEMRGKLHHVVIHHSSDLYHKSPSA